MGIPDPADYVHVAQAAARESANLQSMGNQFAALGDRAEALVGGTATALDRQMVQSTHEAQGLLKQAARQLADAAAQARRAAQEAQEVAEAERHRQQAARGGR